jgi:hypothetical protein
MATGTLGTAATTTLTSLNPWTASTAPADVASIGIAILNDLNVNHPIFPGAFAQNGLLYVPNRGVLRVLPGDYVGVDPNGWPILVSKNSIAGSGWSHSP